MLWQTVPLFLYTPGSTKYGFTVLNCSFPNPNPCVMVYRFHVRMYRRYVWKFVKKRMLHLDATHIQSLARSELQPFSLVQCQWFAGAQFSHYCFCGESYNTYGAAPESECNKTCSVGIGICGGSYRNSVYDTSPMGVEQGKGWSGRISQLLIDESVETAVKLVIETKIRLYIHYIYSHTTNLNES